MKIVKRILKISLWSFLAFIVLYPSLWILSTLGLFGDIEFGYYRDVNIVRHAIEKADYTESLDFGIHDDIGVEDFRALIYTKAKWKITLCFWEDMDIRQVCENPKGIIISKSKDRSQILSLESLSEALKGKDIQLRNIRDVIRHFDDVMLIIEANFENPNLPLEPDYSDIESGQYLNIHYVWQYPWNIKPIEEARERLIAQMIERQKQPAGELQNYEFETVKLDSQGNVIERKKKQAKSFYEKLDDSVILEMVEIPAGNFSMGLSALEVEMLVAEELRTNKNSWDEWVYERLRQQTPQHLVTLPKFYMGKFEVTQAQWRAIVKLPKINRVLLPYPSHRKDDYLPIENVSWGDAVEFCDRLSQFTGKAYRLPSEAEWEYACRGGTTTLFNTGETITSDYANIYESYGYAPWSIDRNEPIPVGVVGFANGFGLYDMHGNQGEWCLDNWHESYCGAPTNGSAWIEGGESDSHIQRGGDWNDNLFFCTATWRQRTWEKAQTPTTGGFRVVVVASSN
jgi:formylglycine-generating enzyme required for sulfatase activity